MPRKSVSGIYKIVNQVNGKVYVGSSIRIDHRRREHFSDLKNCKHHSIKLQHSWDKYGEAAFVFEVIEHVSGESELLVREQHWMDHYNAAQEGYNVAAIAGRTVGLVMSEETRKKMSDSHMGKKHSESHRANLIKAAIGRVVSEETRKKMSEIHKGRKNKPESLAKAKETRLKNGYVASPETCAKRIASNKGKKRTQEQIANMREGIRLARAKKLKNVQLEILF